jgi:hypothetical protein
MPKPINLNRAITLEAFMEFSCTTELPETIAHLDPYLWQITGE